MTKEELKKEFEKVAEEYAQDMAMYYESAHGSIPSQFEKYLRNAVEYGYNKANEWHYVKSEEDLPKDNSEYLLLLEHGIRVFGYYNGKWWESWKGDLSWQEVKAYFFVPVPESSKESE